MFYVVLTISLLLLLIAWILFAPIILKIDTTQSCYELKQAVTIKASIHPFGSQILALRVFGIGIKIGPTAKRRPGKKKIKREKTGSSKSSRARTYLIHNIWSCVTLNYVRGSIDLNNVLLNAQLIPVLYFVSNDRVNLTTNFLGHAYLKLRAEIRLYRMLWTFIKFSTLK